MPSYILCFFLLKIQKQNGRQISENVTALHHGLAYNEHKNIISVY